MPLRGYRSDGPSATRSTPRPPSPGDIGISQTGISMINSASRRSTTRWLPTAAWRRPRPQVKPILAADWPPIRNMWRTNRTRELRADGMAQDTAFRFADLDRMGRVRLAKGWFQTSANPSRCAQTSPPSGGAWRTPLCKSGAAVGLAIVPAGEDALRLEQPISCGASSTPGSDSGSRPSGITARRMVSALVAKDRKGGRSVSRNGGGTPQQVSSQSSSGRPILNPRQDRALAPNPQDPHSAGKPLLRGRTRRRLRCLHRQRQQLPHPRDHWQSDPSRCLLRARRDNPDQSRRRIKQQILQSHRLNHQRQASWPETDEPNPSDPKAARLFQILRRRTAATTTCSVDVRQSQQLWRPRHQGSGKRSKVY